MPAKGIVTVLLAGAALSIGRRGTAVDGADEQRGGDAARRECGE